MLLVDVVIPRSIHLQRRLQNDLKDAYRKRESARVSRACSFFSFRNMYISREVQSSTLPWQCLHELCWFQIIAEQEQSEASENFPFSKDLLVEPETDGCSLDLYTQTRLEGKSAATQTRKKNLSKGKMLSRSLYSDTVGRKVCGYTDSKKEPI